MDNLHTEMRDLDVDKSAADARDVRTVIGVQPRDRQAPTGSVESAPNRESLVDLVEHRARRERELTSLYATARALTALGEVDDVLASIVRHAHDLIGTDVTYLSVFDDPQSELTLRAAEGLVSPAFRTARVPANTGVAGMVVATQSPFWVRHYLADMSLTHDPVFDEVFAAEGLVALLGVPLRDGPRVFGILYAADRVERPFEIEEVALLSAFADHAAVALQNARLYQQSQQALTDLRGAYATIERSAAVHEALTRVVLTGGGASEVATLLVEALGGQVAIWDRDDQQLVVTGAGSETAPTLDALRPALAESRRSGHCVTADRPESHGGATHSIVGIVAGDSYLGAVVLTLGSAPTAVEQRTLERAAQILALMTLKQNAVIEAEERVRGELLTEVLNAPRPFHAELLTRAASRHVDIEQFNALLVADAASAGSRHLTRHLHTISPHWAGLAGEYRGAATMVLRAEDLDEVSTDVQRRLRAALREPVLVCATPVSPSAQESLTRPFTMASRCLRILRSLDVHDRGATTTNLGLYATVFDPDRGDDLAAFLTDTLGALLDYDSRRGTDLVATLGAYFDNSTNLTQTAKALHVHMNTLVKRLDRIAGVIGVDWQRPDLSLRLHLAVSLHALAENVGPVGH